MMNKKILLLPALLLVLASCGPTSSSTSEVIPTEFPCTVFFYSDVNHVKKELFTQECFQRGKIAKPEDPKPIDEAFPVFLGWKEARGEKFWDFEKDYISLNTEHLELYGTWSYDQTSNPTLDPSVYDVEDIYFAAPRSWKEVYCYYWNDKNGDYEMWPGIKMNKQADGFYKLEDGIAPSLYDKCIFNNGGDLKTEDLKVPSYQSEENYYVYGDGWKKKADAKLPEVDKNQVWNLVGTMNGWNKTDTTYKLVSDAQGVYSIDVKFIAGTTFKVIKDHDWKVQKDATSVDRSLSDVSCFDLDSDQKDHNIKVLKHGEYKISFDEGGDGKLVLKKIKDYVPDIDPEPTEKYTVNIKVPTSWKTVNLHAWDKNLQSPIVDGMQASWPGIKLELNEEGYYSYDLGLQFSNLVINNGEEQTIDIILKKAENCWITVLDTLDSNNHHKVDVSYVDPSK